MGNSVRTRRQQQQHQQRFNERFTTTTTATSVDADPYYYTYVHHNKPMMMSVGQAPRYDEYKSTSARSQPTYDVTVVTTSQRQRLKSTSMPMATPLTSVDVPYRRRQVPRSKSPQSASLSCISPSPDVEVNRQAANMKISSTVDYCMRQSPVVFSRDRGGTPSMNDAHDEPVPGRSTDQYRRRDINDSSTSSSASTTVFEPRGPPMYPITGRPLDSRQQQQQQQPLASPISTLAGLRGLDNLGNTCYMNCAVQCLAASRPLARYIVEDILSRDLTSIGRNSCSKVTRELMETIKHIWMLSGTRYSIRPTSADLTINTHGINPHLLKRAIDREFPQFAGYGQHDAQELLAALLDRVHEDVNRVIEKPYVVEPDITSETLERFSEEVLAAEAWARYLQRNRSYLVDLFQGQLRCVTKCHACGEKSIRFDPFMYLTLPVTHPETGEPVRNFAEALSAFQAPELLSADECWLCPRCKRLRPAIRSMGLWKTPHLLIAHFKKFQFSSRNQFRKLDIRIPLEDEQQRSNKGAQFARVFINVLSEQKTPPSEVIIALYVSTNLHRGN